MNFQDFRDCGEWENGSRRGEDGEREDEEDSNQEGHVHEFLGSTRIAEEGEDAHNHRFAGVTGPAIPDRGSHVHRLFTRTDSIDHFHIIHEFTGEAIPVGNGRHVHFVRGRTTTVDGHSHRFIFATLIENPIGRECERRRH